MSANPAVAVRLITTIIRREKRHTPCAGPTFIANGLGISGRPLEASPINCYPASFLGAGSAPRKRCSAWPHAMVRRGSTPPAGEDCTSESLMFTALHGILGGDWNT